MPSIADPPHPSMSTSTSKRPSTNTKAPAQPSTPTPTLTFPPAIFSTLSPTSHLLHTLSLGTPTRPSTNPPRTPTQPSPPHLHNPKLPHTVGSSVLRHGATSLTIGITHSILPASGIPDPPPQSSSEEEKLASLGLLVPNVEIVPGCSARFAPSAGGGHAPGPEAQGLSVRVLRLLLGGVGLEDLTVRRGGATSASADDGDMDMSSDDQDEAANAKAQANEIVAYHVLHLHILILSLDTGTHTLLDAIWGAVYAALLNTRLPRSWWDPDIISSEGGGASMGGVLCSPLAAETKPLGLTGRPVACSWGIFAPKQEKALSVTSSGVDGAAAPVFEEVADGKTEKPKQKQKQKHWILTDPTASESEVCKETVTLVVDCSDASSATKILAVEKTGGVVVGREEMRELADQARQRWELWDRAFEGMSEG